MTVEDLIHELENFDLETEVIINLSQTYGVQYAAISEVNEMIDNRTEEGYVEIVMSLYKQGYSPSQVTRKS